MNYGFEIVCASIFTVFCIISARIYSYLMNKYFYYDWLRGVMEKPLPFLSLLNRAYTFWDRKKVNGPLPRYIYGSWSGFAEKFLGYEDYNNVLKFGKVYGTYDGLTPNLIVTDPELIKEIIATSADKFQDIRFMSESTIILKDSLLSLCGGEKPEVQILLSSLLGPNTLSKLIPRLESSAEMLINRFSKTRQEDGLVNITSNVADFIDEIIAHAIFGVDLNADIQFRDEFVQNSKQILKVKSPQSIKSLLPFLYGNYFREPWIFPVKALQYFTNLIMSGISESSNEAILLQNKASNLIELMVEAANKEKLLKKEKEDENLDVVLTDNAVISKCIATMLSLANATRTTVLLGIYALANDEDVQEKLHKEVEKNKSEVISYEGIQHCEYLDKVLKEVMRLYPFEYRLERVTIAGVKLGETELEKNIRVSIPLYALHQLKEHYSEPEKFDPERFSQGASEKRNSYTYMPFGQAGVNGSDISLQLGVFAAKVTLFRLIEKFKFSTAQQLGLNRLFQKGFTRIPQPAKIEVFVETRI